MRPGFRVRRNCFCSVRGLKRLKNIWGVLLGGFGSSLGVKQAWKHSLSHTKLTAQNTKYHENCYYSTCQKSTPSSAVLHRQIWSQWSHPVCIMQPLSIWCVITPGYSHGHSRGGELYLSRDRLLRGDVRYQVAGSPRTSAVRRVDKVDGWRGGASCPATRPRRRRHGSCQREIPAERELKTRRGVLITGFWWFIYIYFSIPQNLNIF